MLAYHPSTVRGPGAVRDVRTKCLSLANMLMMSDMVDFQVKVKFSYVPLGKLRFVCDSIENVVKDRM